MLDRVYARRPFKYGSHDLAMGEVIEIEGLPNDEKLVRLGYFATVRSKAKTFECNRCGKKFLELGTLDAHGRRDHEIKTKLNPAEEDARADRDEAMINQVAPLYLDKTSASLRA